MPLFSLQNVKFLDFISYPDIEINEGKATFICGDSGCGKSTLLKLLNGINSASKGIIKYLDKAIEEYNPIVLRREILLVSQLVYLFDGTIKDNFNEFFSYRDLEMIRDEEIQQYLSICSVNLPLDYDCRSMSGGEQQRVFIAICLALKPDVLMLDEPTSALDEKNANALMENITGICRETGKTLLVVSHDKKIAEKYADHIILLH